MERLKAKLQEALGDDYTVVFVESYRGVYRGEYKTPSGRKRYFATDNTLSLSLDLYALAISDRIKIDESNS